MPNKCLLVLLLSCFAVDASEELNPFDMSLEQLLEIKVSTVTKKEESLRDVPASITVITRQDILRYGYSTISELVNTVAGFSAINNQVYSDFGVRGAHAGLRAGNRVFKVLINGQQVQFRSNGHNYLEENLVPMSIVNRVEVIRGPSSTIYGANAYLGVINIVTADNYEGVSTIVSGQYRDFEQAEGGLVLDASVKHQRDNFQYLFSVSAAQQDRSGLELPKISPDYRIIEADAERHVVSKKDESKPINVFFQGRYHPKAGTQFDLQYLYQELDAHNAFSDVTPLHNEGYSRINLINHHINLLYGLELDDNHQFSGKVNFSKGRSGGDDIVEVGAQDFYLQRKTEFNALDLQAELSSSWNENNTTLIGLDHSDEDYILEYFNKVQRDTGEHESFTQPQSIPVDNTGMYVQWQHRFSDQIQAIAGLRIDRHTINSTQTSKKFGVTWSPYEALTLKLLRGESFQAPTVQLMYREAVQAGDIIGNPNLESQEAETYELIANWQINSELKLDATIFRTQVSNLVVFEDDFANLFAQNSRASESYGWELELKYQHEGWSAYGNWSGQHTDIEPDEKSLFVLEFRKHGELMPDNTVNAGLSYMLEDRSLILSAEHKYVSSREASSQNVILAQQFYHLDAYQNTNFFLKWFFLGENEPNTSLQFKVKNAFNNRYVHPGFGGIDYPTLGRTLEVGFSKEF